MGWTEEQVMTHEILDLVKRIVRVCGNGAIRLAPIGTLPRWIHTIYSHAYSSRNSSHAD